jgi:hypothetical protein
MSTTRAPVLAEASDPGATPIWGVDETQLLTPGRV